MQNLRAKVANCGDIKGRMEGWKNGRMEGRKKERGVPGYEFANEKEIIRELAVTHISAGIN